MKKQPIGLKIQEQMPHISEYTIDDFVKFYRELPQPAQEHFNRLFWVYELKLRMSESPIEQIMQLVLEDLSTNFNNLNDNKFNMMFSLQEEIEINERRYRVDFLIDIKTKKDNIDMKKIIIECDGHDFHEKTKFQAKHDKEKDRLLQSKGYIVLRFTGSEIWNMMKCYSDLVEIIFSLI